MTALLRILVFTAAVIASALVLARLIRPAPPAPPTGGAPEFRDLTLDAPQPVPAVPPGPPEPTPPPAPSEPAPPAEKPKPAVKITPPAPPSPEATAGTAPPQEPQLSDQEFYARLSRATVQIFCSTRREIFAASGVIVNERGLILTNAHVAEVVEKAGAANCQARHGNPAERFAGLRVLFKASTTPKIADSDVPKRDAALLDLVEPQEPFAVAPIRFGLAERGSVLLTLGYPSEFLQNLTTAANSNLVFSLLRVDGYADLDGDPATAEGYVFRGGIILQQGSSGTALFTRSGALVGLIFATTKGKTTDDREGLALMTPYIDRILREEAGRGLAEFIANN